MKPRDSEKMRHELESFLNSSLKQPDDAWPVKHPALLKWETRKEADRGVLVGDASAR